MKLERIPWSDTRPPDAKTLKERLLADGFEPFRWDDPAGAFYPPHHHDHDESLWCIEGEITFGIEGHEYRLGPGDRLMLPKGTVHSAKAGPGGAAYWIGQR